MGVANDIYSCLIILCYFLTFFCSGLIYNNLPASVDFMSLSSFKRTVKLVDLSKFLKCS